MNPTREDCRHARQVSEARHCAHHSRRPPASLPSSRGICAANCLEGEDRDDFIGAVGVDALPHLLTHDQKLERALNLRDGRCSLSRRASGPPQDEGEARRRDSTTKKNRRPVIDTPIVAAIALCVCVACLSGVAVAAGWV